MDRIKKNFGFGCMRLPMIGEEVDIEQTKQMVDAFLDAGFNYFDTAHGYIQGKSEKALKTCLTSRYPREKYILTDKLTANYFKTEADIRPVFESQLPTDQKIFYNIAFEAMAPTDAPVTITQDEYMRRMKEMAAMSGGGMSQFYSQMPDNYTIAVNANHPLVIDILGEVENEYGEKLKTINKKIETAQKQQANLNELIKDKKEADLTEEEKQQRDDLAKKVDDLRGQRTARLKEIGAGNSLVKQLIDLALLSNGMLKGEQLTNFIKRSVELIGK